MKIKNIEYFFNFMPENQFNYSVHISEKYKYVYFEIPKVACSTIKANLYFNEGIKNLDMKTVHNKNLNVLLSPKKVGYDKFLDILYDKGYIKFTFVRNPYSRVLSAYESKFLWESKEKKEFFKLNNLSNKQLTFSEFLEILAKNSPYDMNPHWRVQYNQIFGLVDYNILDFIGKFENLNEELINILRQIFNKKIDKLVDSRKDLGQKQTNASEKFNNFFKTNDFNLINKIYDKDFDKFDYEKVL